MDDRALRLLLLAHSSGGSLEELLSIGYSYSQIAGAIDQALARDLLYMNDNSLQLTAEGEGELRALSMRARSCASKPTWIRPDADAAIDRISSDEVYLPPRSFNPFDS